MNAFPVLDVSVNESEVMYCKIGLLQKGVQLVGLLSLVCGIIYINWYMKGHPTRHRNSDNRNTSYESLIIFLGL